MFGLIFKKNIKSKLQREYDKGYALCKREMTKEIKELNLTIKDLNDKIKRDDFSHKNELRKCKRDYLEYKDNKKVLLKSQAIVEYLDNNYLTMSPQQTMHCITKAASWLLELEKSEDSEEKKIKYLMDLKVG